MRPLHSDPEKYGYWSTKGWPTPAKLGNKYIDALEYYIEQGVYAPEAKTVAIYGEDTDWGRSFAAGVIDLFEAAGWEIVSEEYFPLEQTEYTAYLNQVKDSGSGSSGWHQHLPSPDYLPDQTG